MIVLRTSQKCSILVPVFDEHVRNVHNFCGCLENGRFNRESAPWVRFTAILLLSHPYEACFVNTDGSYLRLHLLNSSPPMISIGQVSEQQTTNKWQNLAQGRFPSYFLLSHSSGQSHSTFRLFLVSRPLFSWRLTRSDQTGFPKKFHPQKKSKNTNFPKCSNLQIFEVSDRRSTLINNNNQSTHTWLPGTLLLKKDG